MVSKLPSFFVAVPRSWVSRDWVSPGKDAFHCGLRGLRPHVLLQLEIPFGPFAFETQVCSSLKSPKQSKSDVL